MARAKRAAGAGLTEARLASLLAYCKLTELADDPEVEALIPALYAAAIGYLAGAGVDAPEPGTPRAAQYELCVNYLVLDGWDRRDMAIAGATVSDNPMFRRLVNQLKLTGPSPTA